MIAVSLLALALLAAPPVAPPAVVAAPTAAEVERAHTLYRAGSQAYRQGRYDVAIPAFEEARRLAPRPPVLFSLAQSYRLQYFVDGDPDKLARAVALYRAYVDVVGDGGRRDHAAQHLSTLVPLLRGLEDGDAAGRSGPGRLIVSTPVEGATAHIGADEPSAMPATFVVAPGPVTVTVAAPGHQSRRTETVAVAGSVVALEVDLEPLPARLAIDAAPGTFVRVDGRLLGQTPLDAPLALAPGRHRVVLAAPGRTAFVQFVDLDRAEEATLAATLETSPLRLTAIGLFVGGGLLVAGGGVATALAFDAESDALALEDAYARRGLTSAEAERHRVLVDRRDSRRLTAGALTAAGLTTLAVGAVLWVIDDPPGDGPALQPGLSLDGGAIGWRW